MPSSSGAEESDQQREAEAYNNSIYLMVAAPYLMFGAVAFWVYRGLRRKTPGGPAAGRSRGQRRGAAALSDAVSL